MLWGLRLAGQNTNDGVKKHFGSQVTTIELYAHAQKPDSRLGLEFAITGWGASSRETGPVVYNLGAGNQQTTYTWSQDLVVIPTLVTLLYGPRTSKYSLQAGGGAGLYVASLQRRLSFAAADAESAFGSRDNPTKVTGGPHVQVNGDYYFTDHFGLALFGRWAYARFDEYLYRDFLSATSTTITFAQGDKAGNIGGFVFGGGLALKF